MVHLLVLGLLALLFSCVAGCYYLRYFFLFYRFSGCSHGQSVVSAAAINGTSIVFKNNRAALS